MSHYTFSSSKPCYRRRSPYQAVPGGNTFLAQDDNIRELIGRNSISHGALENAHLCNSPFAGNESCSEPPAATEHEWLEGNEPQNQSPGESNSDNSLSDSAVSDRAVSDSAAEEVPAIEYSSNGTTHCDRETGKMLSSISNTACTKKCTEAHEVDHRDYRKDCCKTYSAYRAIAVFFGNTKRRNKLTKKYNKWVRDTSDYSECRAYSKSVECGKKLKQDKSCSAPKKADVECCDKTKSYLTSMKKKKKARCPGTDQACPDFS